MSDTQTKEQTGLSVGLLLTYQCNLDCSYCYIPKKSNKQMSFSVAQKILEPVLNAEGPPMDILFMGAESLTAFSTLKAIVEWVESQQWKRRYRFNATTNGTLLTADIKAWLKQHKKWVTLALSYDGVPESQDKNRSGSSKQIDLDFFLESWPQQELQMTINEYSVSKMADGVISLLERGFLVNANVAYEENEWSDESVQEYAIQLNLLLNYYLTHPSASRINQFTLPLIEYADNLDNPKQQTRQCGAGDGFSVYDVDGSEYPCHIISPLVLTKAQLADSSSKITDTTCFADERCVGCPYVTDCPTCMGCNLKYRGSVARRDLTHCKMTMLEVMATIKLQTMLLLNKKELSPDDAKMVDAINKLTHKTKSILDTLLLSFFPDTEIKEIDYLDPFDVREEL